VEEQLYLDRRASFALLADIVAENQVAGRRSYGASLKPVLKRRTEGAFDETLLGFPSFGAFLRAAAETGVVDVYKAPRGPDWVAVPTGLSHAEPPQSGNPPRTQRIRTDLWAGLVDWREGLRRVYHRGTDRAYLFPSVPRPGERPEEAAQRRLYEAKPDEYTELPQIPFETQVGWMREFAEGVEDTAAREVLLFALGRDRPAREFADALRSKPDLLI
jgi:hypothetical protein